MHLGSLQRDHGTLGPLCPSKLYVSWWVLDLARAAAKFSLAVTSVIITYLVAFSATNMHIHHKVAIWHLMQAWARFALQCFSFC